MVSDNVLEEQPASRATMSRDARNNPVFFM
jgi:hypothetical protein